MLTRNADDQFSIAMPDAASAQALATRLLSSGRWLDVVPGINSVVVRFDIGADNAAAAHLALEQALGDGSVTPVSTGEVLEVPVVYGGTYGPDLSALCRRLGISEDEFIARHTGRENPVELLGFTPGFAFVGELDPSLRIPRRSQPRAEVPAGSVGIAGSRSGLYAIASPGGWTLVGRTSLRLFDPCAEQPFLIDAGMRIRFRAIDATEFGA